MENVPTHVNLIVRLLFQHLNEAYLLYTKTSFS